jgi:nucleotide-binding universal stress UspA family protein
LVPVDGSDHSIRAAEYARDLSGLVKARIAVIHCHRKYPTFLGQPYHDEAVVQIQKEANELLEPFRELYKEQGIEYSDNMFEGPAGSVIPEIAEAEEADLIVMGSRGRTDLKGLVLGSVTHRVLHLAPCPVLVIR